MMYLKLSAKVKNVMTRVAKMQLDKRVAFHSIILELFFLCTTTTELSLPLAVANQKSAKIADD